MKFSTMTAALLAGVAAAATENVDISDLTVRKTSGEPTTIQSVSFKLKGDDADGLACEASNPAFPSEVITCGESKYRFVISAGEPADESEFGLRVYHELGTAVGSTGFGNVPTYCRAGGAGPNDFVCQQTGAATIVATTA
ncbi:hypothetical protein N3K66_002879 [Trichothecium roseum]|uniref:Uncharacterized protein n=1 Tax=Trichothecium roseum TaxID=47278 RepID=A0ACC0V4H7_9HYPO|nr:hypothetical protein N3K66_002879 [Trichothecium roseum]